MSKAQATGFVIIGFLITISAFLILLPSDRIEQDNLDKEYYSEPIINSVDSCTKEMALEAIKLIGIQGGYILPEKYIEEQGFLRSVIYYNQTSHAPTIEDIEGQISGFISLGIKDCLNVSQYPAEITVFENFETEVRKEKVIILPKMEIIIDLGDSQKRLERFKDIRIDSSIGKVVNEVSDLLENHSHGSYIDINPLTLNTTVNQFSPVYKEFFIELETMPYIFSFIYEADNDIDDLPPKIHGKTVLNATKGETFSYKVSADDPEGPVVRFRDETPLFDISKDGLINFTPKHTGSYIVPVYAYDKNNNTGFKIFELEVKE